MQITYLRFRIFQHARYLFKMSINIIQNTTGYCNPSVSILTTGWTITGIYASHESCNSGLIKSQNALGIIVGHQYVIKYTVDNYSSGQVYAILGGTTGTARTANDTYTETLTCTTTAQLSFFSDGGLRISLLSFYDVADGLVNGTTVCFNEKYNRWTPEYSFIPELMIKFIDDLFSIKNGQLWMHNQNPIVNNFYGVQYSSKITFIVNQDYQREKIYYNFRLDAKGNWYMPNITTPISNQFPNGMLTQLKKNNFKLIDNKLRADLLNDVSDPNFATISDPVQRRLAALFGGRKMQGGWLIVDLVCDDTSMHEISSVEVYYTDIFRDI